MQSVEGARRLTTADVKAEAKAAGFDLCGVAPVASFPELGFLGEWLSRGYAGEMHYMQRTADRRADVRAIMPSARSVISLGVVYNTDRPYSNQQSDPTHAAIARYAWGDDYHVVIGQRLGRLVDRLRTLSDEEFDARAYVDTGPVQERVYAQYAGLGWIGKNTCLINEPLGSWFFLGEIITSLDLEPGLPPPDRCGSCTRCIEACPTDAIVPDGDGWRLDARLCISYLTIELRGPIPEDLRAGIGDHVFGCDICQDVCPWNSKAPVTEDPDFAGTAIPLAELAQLSPEAFRERFKDSAIARATYSGLMRNVGVAVARRENH